MAQKKPADAVTVKKKLPELRTDNEAEAFVEQADLTEYDLSHFKRVRFELGSTSAEVNLLLPRSHSEARG